MQTELAEAKRGAAKNGRAAATAGKRGDERQQGMPSLILVGKQDEGEIFLEAGDIVIGRDKSAELMLDDSQVSRRHALLHVNDEGAFISDLGSSNGVIINDRRFQGFQRKQLHDGDVLTFGLTSLIFRDSDEKTSGSGLGSSRQTLREMKRPKSNDPLRMTEKAMPVSAQHVLASDPEISKETPAAGIEPVLDAAERAVDLAEEAPPISAAHVAASDDLVEPVSGAALESAESSSGDSAEVDESSVDLDSQESGGADQESSPRSSSRRAQPPSRESSRRVQPPSRESSRRVQPPSRESSSRVQPPSRQSSRRVLPPSRRSSQRIERLPDDSIDPSRAAHDLPLSDDADLPPPPRVSERSRDVALEMDELRHRFDRAERRLTAAIGAVLVLGLVILVMLLVLTTKIMRGDQSEPSLAQSAQPARRMSVADRLRRDQELQPRLLSDAMEEKRLAENRSDGPGPGSGDDTSNDGDTSAMMGMSTAGSMGMNGGAPAMGMGAMESGDGASGGSAGGYEASAEPAYRGPAAGSGGDAMSSGPASSRSRGTGSNGSMPESQPVPRAATVDPSDQLGLQEVRELYIDLVGRGPLAAERQRATGGSRRDLVARLCASKEFYENWYAEELFFFLLIDNFRPATPRMQGIPVRLLDGQLTVPDAIREIVICQYFNQRNPGNDTYVTVVLEQLLGIRVQDRKNQKHLEAGKRMYDGYRSKLFDSNGSSQSDFVRIVIEQQEFTQRLVARTYRRLVGLAAPADVVSGAAARLERDPGALSDIVATWVTSEAYLQRVKLLRPKSERVFIRTLYVDLLGRSPSYAEFRNMRNALQALTDSAPLKSVLARLLVNSSGASLPGGSGSDEVFVRACFERFLARQPNATELDEFVEAMGNPACTRRLVALAILTHPEYRSY